MYIVSGNQMKNTDSMAINNFGIPSLVLMERAGLETVNVIIKTFKTDAKAVIICGKGNNGGDGFTVARMLFLKGFYVKIICYNLPESFSDDCRANYELCVKLGIKIISDINEFENTIGSSDFVVDALFGFGFHGLLSGFDLEVVKLINNNAKYVYSIDIPSGINADNTDIFSDAVKADETITFTAYKKSSFLFPAADFYGKITVADIGIPNSMITYEARTIAAPNISRRRRNVNKSCNGKILVIAGSRGMSGAAYLSSLAALRAGAGLVTLAVPECISDALEQKTTEVMTVSMPDFNGMFSASASEKFCKIINNYDAVVFGPGVGRGDGVKDILISLLHICKVPFIIDADGLYALKDCLDALDHATCEIIITPHSMEMSRLCGDDVEFIEANRYDVCRSFSERYAICTVLKGAYTVICDKSGDVFVNTQTGNPGMATAGSGDVLSGIIAAFVANGESIYDMGKAAVYIHGLAGDLACNYTGEYSLIATDIINNIGRAINSLTD